MYPTGFISVKVRPDDLPETIALFEKTVTEFTSYPFEFQFLDDSFDQLYKNEARLGETFGFFTVIALLIASLGLFGLAAYSAEQRTKEIGIRKTLGATVSGLVALLSNEFLKLVGLAFVVAAPLAYFAMQRWLEDFAYHIELGPGIFLMAGATALIIALASVSYQAIKAARANPVKSLRYE
jgi:putative ABC transport system permease protein